MDNVILEYTYTDDDGRTALSPPLVLAGPATQAELVRMWRCLGPEGLFIPELVGLPPASDIPLSAREGRFHELSYLRLTPAPPNCGARWEDLLVRIESASRRGA